MNIKPLGAEYQNSKAQTFKSVVQLHYWTYNDKIIEPVTDIKKIDKFQKKVAHVLNKKVAYGKKSSADFFNKLIENFSQNDKDYRDFPYVITFYNKNARKYAEKGGYPVETAPFAYLITGKDAIKFQDRFATPVRNLDVNDKEAKTNYFFNAIKFLTTRNYSYLQKKNLELHAIFTEDDLIKIDFYPSSGKDNPYVKMGYKK